MVKIVDCWREVGDVKELGQLIFLFPPFPSHERALISDVSRCRLTEPPGAYSMFFF